MDKEYYISMRNKYLPTNLKTVFILESPPASGKYFYDETGSTKEPLFAAMMKLHNFESQDKREGLKYFANTGNFLVDATYETVDKLNGKIRNETILKNFNHLVSDLERLGDPKQIDFILIKANICRLLEARLLSRGFNVRNDGLIIPFPSTGNQKKFYIETLKILGPKT